MMSSDTSPVNNTMNPITEKITIRWLIDHVPIKFWIGSGAIAMALFGAGITFSKYDFIDKWFNDLVSSESEATLEKFSDINRQLDQKNKTLSQVNENKTIEINKLKGEIEKTRGINKQLEQENKTLLLVNKDRSVGNNDMKIEQEENRKIKNELIQNIVELNKKITTSEELISSLKNDNRLINDEVVTLKKKLDTQSDNTDPDSPESNTNKASIEQPTKADIISRYNAALKISGMTTQTNTLSLLAMRAADLKYFKTAFEIALNISGYTTQTSTLSYVALRIAKSGDIEYAIKVVEKISGSTTKTDTLAQIAKI